MFSQTSVILSRGLEVYIPLGRHPHADTPLGRHPPWQTPPRQTSPLHRHPGQTPPIWPLQRTVRILLECILVSQDNNGTKNSFRSGTLPYDLLTQEDIHIGKVVKDLVQDDYSRLIGALLVIFIVITFKIRTFNEDSNIK